MTPAAHQERPSRTELGRCLIASGALRSDWVPTFSAVDRAWFLPDVMWPFLPDEQPGGAGAACSAAVDRRTDPAAWYGHADSDVSIVTQWDDGRHQGLKPGTVPTSSSSQPGVVYQMLGALDAEAGMTVFDAGTGTGETAGLLAHRCGARQVTTCDVDQAVSNAARARLQGHGLHVGAVTADALAGHAEGGPYDRFLCTFGVRAVPAAWLRQVRAGGVIVVPYGTHYSNRDTVVRLTVHPDGTASGPFVAPVEFMKARAHRLRWPDAEEYVTDWPKPSSTHVRPDRLADAAFVLSHAVPHVAHAADSNPDGAPAVWLYSMTDRSWAAVTWPDEHGPGKVYQRGPRRLWDAVEAVCGWWGSQGCPGLERFGLTVTPEGAAPWLDSPGNVLPGW
ncbi:methyltransferase domain-containing protein [Streptomyces sp. P9(2023)]|uniref:methyltransferase domain-containing protein n=1 Tax=Streptomyces sp. P9(2023) TaxID=3064394 RepID=UPI0028F452D0|nr:methyltransferase domain-containing protein [Streptomyces sp. P9(2023)]MDT9693229.1 methyltransferase domain-containing protein [Streptomyces sp. P9(2023)]